MKLSFSTLSCPEWDWETIQRQAKVLGYGGIEVRGLQSELEIENLPIFRKGRIGGTLTRLKEAELSLTCLDTSCDFLGSEDLSRTIQSGLAALEMASLLGVPYIRVFGDVIPPGMHKDAAVELVAGALRQLGSFAQGLGVAVLLETHGSFSESRLSLGALELANCPSVGLLWDSANTYEAGEAPEFTWHNIGHLVRHVHMKDFELQHGKAIPCLPGRGEVPLGTIIRTLTGDGYDGWVSFEWEKRWVPSIEGPEIALPAFVEYVDQIYHSCLGINQ